MSLLIDEKSTPTLRTVLGSMLARAERADFAIHRIRLAAIDLSSGELGHVRQCRVILGRVDADLLQLRPTTSPGDSLAAARRLTTFLQSGRLEVRACPRIPWAPDFSILHDITLADGHAFGSACLVGAHWFREPPTAGPSLTSISREPAAVRRALQRFTELWNNAHDVRPAVEDALLHLADQLRTAFES